MTLLIERKVLTVAPPGWDTERDPAHSAAPFILHGYASTFGNVDAGRDVVLPSAFTDYEGARLALLAYHDTHQPIGSIIVTNDSYGLKGELQFNRHVQKAVETYHLGRAGDVTAMSIGFSVPPGGSYRKGDIRYLQRVSLAEISVVVFPMNSRARLIGTKAHAAAEAAAKRLAHRTARAPYH